MPRSRQRGSFRALTALSLVSVAGTALAGPEPTPIPVTLSKVETFSVTSLGVVNGQAPNGGNTGRETCQLASTYASETFAGGTYLVQAGFVENEIMAARYTLPASLFPIRIDVIDALIGTAGTNIQTTTQWTILVWDGPPTGAPIASYSSDDIILPHIVIPPGPAQAVNLAFSIDPGDPEQIFINNTSGTNSFTIGFRIDEHQEQTGNGCLPSPPQNRNAFPMTDAGGVASPTGNWISAIDCGAFGFCTPGWSTFQSFPALCRPSGDWMLQATWTSFTCDEQTGACCDGQQDCFDLTEAECNNIGGDWQGAGTICATTECPIPEGACCLTNGNCLFLDESTCDLIAGTWQGANVPCNGSLCPIGAACLPDGSCIQGVTALEASAMGGTFLGVGTTCATANCPQPTGACCITTTSNCLVLSEANCELIPNAVWLGMGTICDANGDTVPDGTCNPPSPCLADTNADGMLSPADFSAWISAYNTQAPPCDQNTDGNCTAADFSAWIANYNAGC